MSNEYLLSCWYICLLSYTRGRWGWKWC